MGIITILNIIFIALIWHVRAFYPAGAWYRTLNTHGVHGDAEADIISVFEHNRERVAFISRLDYVFSPMTLDVQEIDSQTGSGWVWDDSHIITNNHVIGNAPAVRVTLLDSTGNRTVHKATVRGRDVDKDIAVLKLEERTDTPAFVLALSSELRVGQTAVAIGNPFGLDHTITKGIVSGLGRSVRSQNRVALYNMIQTDAAINPGNSGGPLLDSRGNLIGMNTAIFSPSGAFSGIGFAIPSDTISAIVSIIIAEGQVTRAGTGITYVGGDQAKALGVDRGIIVLTVSPGSAAAAAGLRGLKQPSNLFAPVVLGDVIVNMDGMNILNEADYLTALDGRKAGETVKMTILRRPASALTSTNEGEVYEPKLIEVRLKLQAEKRKGSR